MKILIANITDSGIYRNRAELIARLIEDGHSVTIVAPRTDVAEKLIAMGCKYVDVHIQRHGMNPKEELKVVNAYRKILNQEQPDYVFSYTIKPNLYLGLLCRLKGIPYSMNITGLGEGLLHEGWAKKVIMKLYPIATKKAKCIFFQNEFNRQFFVEHKLADQRIFRLIPGSGVNISKFRPLEYPNDAKGIRFLFVSRIVKDKGIDELIEAIKIIKKNHSAVEFHFAGGCSEEYELSLNEWKSSQLIVYHGHISPDEMAQLYQNTHCLIHPSYHEGMANVILECAACARPCLASDINGCKEAIDNGKTGFTFKVKSVQAIIDAIEKFISLSYDEKRTMGIEGRKKMEREFDRQLVVNAYLKQLYPFL